jgi:hypothetical protein
MAWKTVAICDDHWAREEGDRTPIRVQGWDVREPCYRTGCLKYGDIYVRREVNIEPGWLSDEMVGE